MSAFSDRPLVAGTLNGLRAFKVDRLGRLISPSYATAFRPGENVAECRKSEGSTTSMLLSSLYSSYYDPFSTSSRRGGRAVAERAALQAASLAREVEKVAPKVPTHTPGVLDCSCGWYAYYDGGNDYVDQDESERVGAVIKGWGTCTVGSRGFRAQKAELVGLIEPSSEFSNRDHRWERVLHNYPGVPVYLTTDDALAAHPLTDQRPTPETHGDDFWSLEALR